MTLRGRLVVLICLATLPAMLFTVYIAQKERSAAIERTMDDAHYILDLLSREHLYQLTGAEGLLRWLTTKLSAQGNSAFVHDSNFLSALLAGYPQLGNIAILSPNGDVINSAYPLPGAINMSYVDAIRRALRSKDIETGVYIIGPIVKRPLLHLAQSIRDSGGQVRWVVFVAIDLDWLKHLADKIELPTQHILMIVDRDGRVLASSSRPDAHAYPPGMQIPELAQANRLSKGIINIVSAGVRRSFVTAPVEGIPGLLLATAVPWEHISDKANETFYRMLASLTLLTLVTAGSVVFLEEVALLRYLRSLSNASRRFGEGDYSARVNIPRGYGELQNMARVFNTMAETLTGRHRELTEARDELDKLSRHLQIARESEAQRIARDLHDEVGQVLTSIKLDLSSFQRQCKQKDLASEAQEIIESNVAALRNKLDGLVDFVRRIASDLRPPVLDRMGLASAIELLARNLEDKTELVIDLEIGTLDEPLDWLISTTIYRIVQEALTNIARHAEASEVSIKLHQTDDRISLSVEDNGRGMETGDRQKESLGIIGMRERARTVNGFFSLDSTPGKGTVVSVKIPAGKSKEDRAHPSS